MDLSAYVLGNRGSISLTMGSFKLRLVIYFMLLALLPLVAATVAFSEVAERGETGATDSRLSTAIRVALVEYQEQLEEDTAGTAHSLARATQVQQALATSNRSALVRTAREVPNAAFYSASGEYLAGKPAGAVRRVPLGQGQRRRGQAARPRRRPSSRSTTALASRLGMRAALDDGDRFRLRRQRQA